MQNQLLLLDDVDNVGRSGDVVSVRPGFARNFLLPQKKAVVADKFTLRLQDRLKAERAMKAEVDKKEALSIAERIAPMELTMVVKVDPDGHMYGSVAAVDIVKLLDGEKIVIERKNVVLAQPIKELGAHTIQLKLKEGVPATFTLKLESDRPLPKREVVPVQSELPEAHEQ
jgi:large subunit ribosomal protein L9